MRNQYINQAFLFMICSIAVVLAAIFFQKSSSDLGKVARECPQKIERLGGEMLWESFSSQFAAAVHN